MAYSLCGSSVDNTGEQECDKSRGVGRKLFITAAAIAPADFATKEAFMAKLVANSKLSKNHPDKVFPINELQDIADNSEANKEGSLNLGFSAVLLEGKPKYTFKVFAGSDLLKRYRSFNNQTVRIIEYDANGVFWVTKVGANAKGFQFKLFTTGNKLATGQAVEEGVVTITASVMSNTEYLDNCFWVESNGNVEDIKALIDVQLAYVSNASNVYKYSAKYRAVILPEITAYCQPTDRPLPLWLQISLPSQAQVFQQPRWPLHQFRMILCLMRLL